MQVLKYQAALDTYPLLKFKVYISYEVIDIMEISIHRIWFDLWPLHAGPILIAIKEANIHYSNCKFRLGTGSDALGAL